MYLLNFINPVTLVNLDYMSELFDKWPNAYKSKKGIP